MRVTALESPRRRGVILLDVIISAIVLAIRAEVVRVDVCPVPKGPPRLPHSRHSRNFPNWGCSGR